MPEALLALLGVALLVLAALIAALGAPAARTPLVILGAALLALAFDWHTIAAGFGH